MMVDNVLVVLSGGRGGRGAVTFRKEKFVPFGGPDGGDGGQGGCVLLRPTEEVRSLAHLITTPRLEAHPGGDGRRSNKIGRAGEDLSISVPVGTVAEVSGENERFTLDMMCAEEKHLVCSGGAGGRGNRSYATSTMKVPRMAEVGEAGETRQVNLTYKMPCDVAIVGEPNVGKSLLLNKMTAAGAKVADYWMTTVDPVVGVMESNWTQYRVVEVPSVWSTSRSGDGVLKHAHRASVVAVVLDASEECLADAYRRVTGALALRDGYVFGKPRLVVVNKADLCDAREHEGLGDTHEFPDAVGVCYVSAATGEGIPELMGHLVEMVSATDSESPSLVAEETPVLRPMPMRRRISVVKEAEAYVVHAGELERLVRGTDISDWEARMQLMSLLEKAGVHQALQKAGVEEGDTVRIGGAEMEWT